MSNNAAVTADGGEIGRAQALQARAARREPLTAMNPVLLKPEHEAGSQVIVRGKRIGHHAGPRILGEARRSPAARCSTPMTNSPPAPIWFWSKGAGSASEINLRHGDIANFGFARAAQRAGGAGRRYPARRRHRFAGRHASR
ncbi:MAG: hypothetical protein V9G20_30245 [Candidatus Promineifilaceae bacterium]